MKVILDTNVLLVALPPHSPYRPIFEKLLDGSYTLVLSNEILTEYEEQIAERYDTQTVKELVGLFTILPNVEYITPYFRWNLIVNDHDDDKFADAAVSANVDYLVTNDRHFDVLRSIDFPKITLCKAEDFKSIVLAQ